MHYFVYDGTIWRHKWINDAHIQEVLILQNFHTKTGDASKMGGYIIYMYMYSVVTCMNLNNSFIILKGKW